jgi:glycosyltransferase involved in cell wall biosynthesis
VLGVANIWSNRKGLDDFFQLSKMLDDSYVIVLVGLTPKQIRQLPKKIKGLARTNSIHDLVAMYSMADIFVNPSKEETFGLTTLEATSCGKTAIVYEGTACEEVIRKTGGVAVPQNVQALYKAIISHI